MARGLKRAPSFIKIKSCVR